MTLLGLLFLPDTGQPLPPPFALSFPVWVCPCQCNTAAVISSTFHPYLFAFLPWGLKKEKRRAGVVFVKKKMLDPTTPYPADII